MEVNGNISLVECPRDAMQGWKRPIATEDKVHYIKALLNVGFDTIDFGSFVSPRAIPQMADTAAVIEALPVDLRGTRLLAIVANERGAAPSGGKRPRVRSEAGNGKGHHRAEKLMKKLTDYAACAG